jgi:hypothetical protein
MSEDNEHEKFKAILNRIPRWTPPPQPEAEEAPKPQTGTKVRPRPEEREAKTEKWLPPRIQVARLQRQLARKQTAVKHLRAEVEDLQCLVAQFAELANHGTMAGGYHPR